MEGTMKEKLKTIAIIILIILSLALIIGCRTKHYTLIMPGHSIRSISIIEREYEMFSDQFELADSMFNDKYNFPLTR